jgi:hypothetical protein
MPTYTVKQPCNLAHAWCALCRPDIRVGAYERTAEISAKNSAAAVRRYKNPAERAKTSAANKGNPRVSTAASETNRRRWKNPRQRTKQIEMVRQQWAMMPSDKRQQRIIDFVLAGQKAARCIPSPNGQEQQLETILVPLGFRFVGNGTLWVGTKNPDFVHETQSVVVEFFGRRFHQHDEGRARRRYLARRGFKMMIVRAIHLQNPACIKRRAARMLGG